MFFPRIAALLIIFTGFAGMTVSAHAEEGMFDTTLPMTVRIIDFESTKKLCGSNEPPHWCPAHLRADQQVVAQETSLASSQVEIYDGLYGEELAKRERINRVKARLGYRQMPHHKM